ncbi:MAG: phytanoyl-CoA dioxygenase family protein [Actinomycetota bacterium]|nr:phytanoyl-CoA dioxygenase family protein [Actinomycetota bacterium]
MSPAAEVEHALAALDVRVDTLDDRERAALDRDGYLVLHRLLDPAHVDAVNAAVGDQLEMARRDPHWHPGGTLHVPDLLDAGPALDAVWTAPRLLAAVVHLLGADLQVRRLHYRSPQPGFGAQSLHADFPGPPPADGAHVATAIVALTDFTDDNGATRVVPGSHRKWHFTPPPTPDTAHPGERLLLLTAGSAVVFSGHLWHSGTRNRSAAGRDALQISFARRGMAGDLPPDVSTATFDRLGPAALLLL